MLKSTLRKYVKYTDFLEESYSFIERASVAINEEANEIFLILVAAAHKDEEEVIVTNVVSVVRGLKFFDPLFFVDHMFYIFDIENTPTVKIYYIPYVSVLMQVESSEDQSSLSLMLECVEVDKGEIEYE